MKGFRLLLGLTLIAISVSAQVPIEEIIEDKNNMADAYYGTFKYQEQPYTGQAIAYHDNGNIKTLRSFKDGKYNGLWTEWYANGNRKFQGDRKDNMGHGLTKWWYENGQLKKQGTYDMDKQQGVVIRWHENGNLSLIRHYNQDKAVGPWVTFDEKGEVFDEGNDENKFYRPFFGSNVAPKGTEETSPSFTADGKTMVLARYPDWVEKAPYIASHEDGKWEKEALPIIDTLYNLAISPKGDRIVYKTFEQKNGEEISRVFISNKEQNGWSDPLEIENLYNINAGYFHIASDGTLYMFARKPRTGIFYSKPEGKNGYANPKWLSDEVCIGGGDNFDIFLNPQQDKLIVTQTYKRSLQSELGAIGFYYFKKEGSTWKRIKRLPLAYGWGANVVGDKFVFVRNGNIQYVPMANLGIDW